MRFNSDQWRTPSLGRIDIGRVSHPLFNRLWATCSSSWVAEHGHTNVVNQVDGKFSAASGNPTAKVHAEMGPMIDFDGTGDYISISHRSVDYTPACTMAVIIEPDASGTTFVNNTGDTTSGNALLFASSTVYYQRYGAGTATANIVLTGLLGRPYLIIGSAKSGTLNLLTCDLRNGVVQTSTSANSHLTNSKSVCVYGADGAGANNHDGKIAAGYVGNSYLTMDEMREWAKDPWGMWREDVYVPAYKAAAAAGLGIPIAAYHYNHHLGSMAS